jgi:uncharacterized protein (AIM24 family)
MKKIGIIIFVIGLLGTLVTGFNFVTREKVVDIGELEIIADQNHTVAWKPALGFGVMLVGGIVFLFGSKRNGSSLLSR